MTAPPPSAPAPAAAPPLFTLKKRAEFRACARAASAHTAGMVVQARRRRPEEAEPEAIRVGFTTSRKLGKAVLRNRARRRLRAAARQVLPARGRPGWDYVLIGRAGVTAERPFARLLADLARALEKLHGSER